MSHELILRPEAEADLTEAFEWYEARASGLGFEFVRSVDSLLSSICRALTRKFPYEIFFVLETETVIILAVFHAKRNPNRWRERI
jgi:plasmid stabilization system protein ParE